MAIARAATHVPLSAEDAYGLWTDSARWATFMDGFGRLDRVDPEWPQEGAKLVWSGVPGGRGTVTERVLSARPPTEHQVSVLEEKLVGTQLATFTPIEAEEDTTLVELELDYKVAVGGPLRPLVDVLFIRRAQNDSLARTLRRFATEAAEQAAL